MGIKHADRIDVAPARARCATRPDLHDFFDETAAEKFFVKNLERVQGDERDAIILSDRLRQGRRRAAALPIRPAAAGRRPPPPQRRDHPRPSAA